LLCATLEARAASLPGAQDRPNTGALSSVASCAPWMPGVSRVR
jgi:hypothetical protein